MITGFLGSGKTTLMRTLLSELAGESIRIAVIQNDIANADLDAATISGTSAASITPISASCACCESLDELVSTCEQAAQDEADLQMIELNGTGDPLGMLELFTLLEDRLPFSPKLLVCVIDIRYWGKRGELNPLERRQMQAAGLYILSHTDHANRADIQNIEATIASAFPGSRRITARRLAAALRDRSPLPAPRGGRRMKVSRGLREPVDPKSEGER
ncbi:MAG: GTP-binding protein, partial [Verrucomicrobiales bacterium]